MHLDPETSVIISFLGFSLLFAKKIYPIVLRQIDGYINSVKQRIQRLESQKDEAYSLLKMAYVKRDDVDEIIKSNRIKSEEKIKRLHIENRGYLNFLKEKHELSYKKQLDAELVKQKNLLIKRLSDSIIEKLTYEIVDNNSKFNVTVNKSDLHKLLGNQRPKI